MHISFKSKWVKWVGVGITAVSFAFLAKSLLSMKIDLSELRHPVLTGLLVAALAVCYAGVVYLSAAAWRLVLRFISQRQLPFGSVADVYVKANIAKYLPGNFMHFAGRNVLAKKLSFGQVDVAFSTVLEVAMLLVTAVVWSAALSFHAFASVLSELAHRSGAYLPLAAALLAAAVAAVLVFLHRRGLLRKYRRFFTWAFIRLLPRLFALYSLTMVIPGLLLTAFLGALGAGLAPVSVLTVVSAYMISWVAGYVVIGSPGGIGVRESVIVLLLGPLCGSDLALLAALLLRASSVLGDVAAYGLQLMLDKRGADAHGLTRGA